MPSLDLRKIQNITDPADRARAAGEALATLSGLSSRLRALRQAAVLELRAQNWSHAQVAEALGITRSRAQQIAEGRTDTRARSAISD